MNAARAVVDIKGYFLNSIQRKIIYPVKYFGIFDKFSFVNSKFVYLQDC
jgi:hypothetical protein